MVNEKTPLNWDTDIAQSERGVSFFHNTLVRMLASIDIVFLLFCFALLGYFIRPTENLVVLHYNVYFGVEIQGAWWQVFILPVAGTLFFLGHLVLAHRFYAAFERIAAYLMLLGSCLLSIGTTIASISIAFINY